MRQFRNTCIAMLTATLLSSGANAEPKKFEFDKAHTDVTFRILHLGYSHTHGRFETVDGDLMIDVDDLSNSSFAVTIDTASIDTAFEKRDDHLRSADFFDVEKFPTMIYKSTSVEKTGEKTLKMIGDLTLLGQTHPIILDVVVNSIAEHPRSKKLTFGATGTGTLQRSQWGMEEGIPNVADEVKLTLDIEAAVAE